MGIAESGYVSIEAIQARSSTGHFTDRPPMALTIDLAAANTTFHNPSVVLAVHWGSMLQVSAYAHR